MCGITGVFAFDQIGKHEFERVATASDQLKHRGPDANGLIIEKSFAFGHKRLSIIDTSDTANQPMESIDGRYSMVFNGEFFNYLEIKNSLESKGHTFKTNSDTEVLLRLFETEGKQCVEKVNGFFSFSIFDRIEHKLFLFRDRYGIKPLYFSVTPHFVCFASELIALMKYSLTNEIDQESLFCYLQLNYIPGPESIFKKIQKVEPGTCMVFSKDLGVEVWKYYKIPEIKHYNISFQKAKEELHSLLDDAVRLRLISDVPLGAFLSGGLDSTIIVSLASKHTRNLKTFSIGFPDAPHYDETYFSRIAADYYKTDHSVFLLTDSDLYDSLWKMLDFIDEPFADSSALPFFILARETSKHVKVALSGDGADELFAGYNKHEAEYKIRTNRYFNYFIEKVNPLLQFIPQSRNNKIFNLIRQLSRYAEGIQLKPHDRYWKWCSIASESEASNLIYSRFSEEEYFRRKMKLTSSVKYSDDFNDVLRADFNLVLANDMLVKVDMMSMANGLEVRVPFLDYRIVDKTFSYPAEYKINQHSRKKILREAFSNELPKEILNRGKKGFEVPLLQWFRTSLRSTIEKELLSDTFIKHQNIFDVSQVRNSRNKLFSHNPGDSPAKIWGLLVFQYWWKKNMGNTSSITN